MLPQSVLKLSPEPTDEHRGKGPRRGMCAITGATQPPERRPAATANEWRRRPVLSALVRVGAVLLPAAIGIGVGAAVSRVLPRPSGAATAVVSFVAVAVVTVLTIIVVERAARRLLPLAALLSLSLLFPDRAPKRFAIARRVGRPRDLQLQLQALRDKGIEGGEVAYMQRVLELVAALSVHDRQTRGHSERVRVFADMIANEMKLSTADRARLRWASLLHDIGKLLVPSEILSKPSALNSAEFDTVRKHPEEGARLIRPLRSWLGEWADAVEHHHERWDGFGYPNRLAGDRISLAGRIVAVADSYEVMTAVRPYRKPLGVAAARQELVKCSGAQFDPVVVRAFLNIGMGRLWRVVGFGSWIAQMPIVAWIDRLGWNWGTAIVSGSTAIALTAPGMMPSPSPFGATPSTPVVLFDGGTPHYGGGQSGAPRGPGTPASGQGPGVSGGTNAGGGSATGGSTVSSGTNGSPSPAPSTPAPTPATPGQPTRPAGPTPTPTPTPTPAPDLPPVVTVQPGGLAVLGSFSGSGSFTDSDLADHTFTATVAYGDGSGVKALTLNGTRFVLSHTYGTLLGTYTVTVTVTDNDGVSRGLREGFNHGHRGALTASRLWGDGVSCPASCGAGRRFVSSIP